LISNITTVLTEFNKPVPCFTVSIFETIIEYAAIGGFNNMRQETEIIAEGKKGILMNSGFAILIKV
jgi:hypothetical protein